MHDAHEALMTSWRAAQEAQVKNQNKRQQPKEFRVGERVLLSIKNLRLPGVKKKLSARFIGPFQVRNAIGSQAYRLALPTSYKIHKVFHVSLLEPWKQRVGEEYTLLTSCIRAPTGQILIDIGNVAVADSQSRLLTLARCDVRHCDACERIVRRRRKGREELDIPLYLP
jgi:hypothetical protein